MIPVGWTPPPPRKKARSRVPVGQQPAWDADLECPHGRVPFDPSPRCGCFPVEGVAEVIRLAGGRQDRRAA